MELPEFYAYRQRLLKFLDDCEQEKEERRKIKESAVCLELWLWRYQVPLGLDFSG